MGPYFLRKYATGTGADVYIPMVKRAVVDHAVSADWTPASGDVKISIDGGAAANIATLPTAIAMGNGAYWKFVFSDAELTGKQMYVEIADSATKAVEDNGFGIATCGNASAMYVKDYLAADVSQTGDAFARIGAPVGASISADVAALPAAVFSRAFSSAYGSLTFDQMIKVMVAVLAGVASGLATSTATFRNLNNSADVVVATVDANGNRSVVTITP